DALRIDTKLALPGNATFALRGTVDFKSKELGYDVVADATRLDLSRVMVNGPSSDLTGGGTARGRGFKPPTMTSDLDFAFGPSRLDTVAVDSIAVQARLANGLATVARFNMQGSANATGLVVRGNAARHVAVTYGWTDARTPQSKVTVTARGDTISALGFAFDSLAADLSYRKPNGSVGVRVRQSDERDYALSGDFT